MSLLPPLGYVPVAPPEVNAYGSRTQLLAFTHSTSSQLLLPVNNARRNVYITNASGSANAFITFGLLSSLTAYTFELLPGQVYEFASIIYLGPISSISSSTSGSILVTEVYA